MIMFFGKEKKSEVLSQELRMHASVTVGAKGQVVIPKEVRDMLDLNEGDTLLTITKYGKFVGFIKTENLPEFIELVKKEAGIIE